MNTYKLSLIVSLSAIINVVSCDIDHEPGPFQNTLANDKGLYDLYLFNVNTNVTTMITSSSDNLEWSYSFSPDSKKILYRDDFGINEMNIDGSENWSLVKGLSPSYSLDGSKIIFTDDQKLYSINTDGTNKTQICTTDIGLWYPVWSRDGENIACSSGNGLCIVDREGNLKVVSVVPGGSYEWSYDSKEIFYSNSSAQIFKYNIIQDKVSQITDNDKLNVTPKCNPVNNEIVFVSSSNFVADLVITDQDGSDQRVIIHKNQISAPCWSPNGDKIVFITDDSDVAVIDKNGENFKIINEIPGACKEPIWSNDGNYILYSRALFYLK